jgi:hypothetical protein
MSSVTEIETTIGRTTNGGPRITRIYHCGEHTVRVRVARDFYSAQSFALAEVLTPALAWTKVCEQPPEEFHDGIGGGKAPGTPTEEQLLALAEDLARRACRILRVPADQP